MSLRCFVIQPFTAAHSNSLYEAILRAANKAYRDIDVLRADKSVLSPTPEENVSQHLDMSDFVIADVTDENPNVMLEVGYAMALSKPIVLISQSIKMLPVNLSTRHVLSYKLDRLDDFESKLQEVIQFVGTSQESHSQSNSSLTHIYSSFDSAGLSSSIGKARSFLDVVVPSLSSFAANYLHELRACLQLEAGLRVRVCSLDPDSSLINERAKSLALRVSQFRQEGRAALHETVVSLRDYRESVEIRSTNTLIDYDYYRVDHNVFIRLIGDRQSRQGLVLALKPTHHGTNTVMTRFESIWNSATLLEEASFM